MSSTWSDKRTKKMVILSLFLGVGIALYVVEYFYIPPLPIPGAKLGLANLITLLILGFYNWRDALFNVVARIIVGSLLIGTFLTPAFYFSLTGGLLSVVVMIIVFRLVYGRVSFVGVSVTGAVTHNFGQLLLATLFISHWGLFLELPFLILVAVFTGTLNGVVANYAVSRAEILRLELSGKRPRRGVVTQEKLVI